MLFTYKALTKDGKSAQGTLEAADKESAVASLGRQGLHPLVIELKHGGGHGIANSKFFQPKVKSREMVIFARQLSTMVSAGVPLPRSLATLQEQAETKYFKQVIGAVAKDVEGGVSLADSFSKHQNVFSDVFIQMVRAGEAGGILDEILKRLAAQAETDASMKKKIKAAMAYPVVILSITILAFFGIMMFVMPKLSKIISDLAPGAELPVYTRVLMSLSRIMQHDAVLVIIVTVVGTYLLRRYLKTPKGKYKFHYLLLKIPIIKGVVTKIAIARFARTFASLMAAGVTVLDALQATGGAIGNKVIEAELKKAASEVKNGKPLSEPIRKSPYFPPIVGQMLAVGEETGQIDSILIKVADFYEEEVSAVIDGLSSLIEPLMIIVLGAIVGVIAASVMGPIANLTKNIGN
jgi:type IV pilus assembly protein PilC